MAVSVKTYLNFRSRNPEVRRFTVPDDTKTSYLYFVENIKSVYPHLADKNFKLYWEDQDGELIAFSSDEELEEAYKCLRDGLLKIFIESDDQNSGSFSSFWQNNPELQAFVNKIFGPECFNQCQQKSDLKCDTAGDDQSSGQCSSFWQNNPELQEFVNKMFGPECFDHCQQKQDMKCDKPKKEDVADGFKMFGEALGSFLQPFGIDLQTYINRHNESKTSDTKEKHKAKPAEKTHSDSGQSGPSNETENESGLYERIPGESNIAVCEKVDGATNTLHVSGKAESNQQDGFQKRLNEALAVMEAMGFKNDNGWLTQLLVAKNLDVGSVINTILPQGRYN